MIYSSILFAKYNYSGHVKEGEICKACRREGEVFGVKCRRDLRSRNTSEVNININLREKVWSLVCKRSGRRALVNKLGGFHKILGKS
jgi:hypothetical protein